MDMKDVVATIKTSSLNLKQSKQLLEPIPHEKLFAFRDASFRNQTILHILAAKEEHDTFDWLLTFPAGSSLINTQDKDGWTPLHAASYHGNLKVCRTLLNCPEVDVSLVTNDNSTPLHYLAKYERKSLQEDSINNNNSAPNTPELSSSPSTFTDIPPEESIQSGSPLSPSVLLKALKRRSAKLVSGKHKLKGSDENNEDSPNKNKKKNSLHAGIVHWLHKVESAWTKHKPAKGLVNDIMDLMIERGVDIDAQNINGETPIQLACLYGCKETVMLFLAKGAYAFTLNNRGYSCLDYAHMSNNPDILDVLDGFVQFYTQWLSDEVIFKIFQFLSPEDLCKTAQVCKLFNRVASDEVLWKEIAKDLPTSSMYPGTSKQIWLEYQRKNRGQLTIRPLSNSANINLTLRGPATLLQPAPEGSDYDFMLKLIVAGRTGSGKTTFVASAMGEHLLTPITSECPQILMTNVGGKRFKIFLWDVFDADYYSRMVARSPWRGVAGTVVLFDITSQESFDELPNWYTELESSQKIIVANKCDLESQRVVTMEEIKNFSDTYAVPFVEASAQNGSGVTDAIHMLVKSLCQFEDSTIPVEPSVLVKVSKKKHAFRPKDKDCAVM